MGWVLGHKNREALITWLLGPAGAGKSAIAQTLAEMCSSLKILLASFFFFRADPARNHPRSLIATIAYQVAINFPDARDIVVRVPENDPMARFHSVYRGATLISHHQTTP
jgi:cytidylate kinase